MNNLTKIKNVFETTELCVVNSLLKDGWVVLGMYLKDNKLVYSLGYIPK